MTPQQVHLIGWMGSGRSALGCRLATTLGWRFVDLDDAITQQAGMSIPQMIGEQGSCLFRALEGERLHQLCFDGEPKVLATGDHALLRAPNRQRLAKSGVVVWLDDGHGCSYAWADLHLSVGELSQDAMVAAMIAASV